MKLITITFIFILLSTYTMAQESSAYQIKDLLAQANQQDGRYLKFLDNEKLTSGIYQLKKGDKDLQEPHEWDELYYVLSGEAVLVVGEERHMANSGAVLFVAANVPHRFEDIEEDLDILVFFSKK